MKKCSRCGEEKPVEAFHRSSGNRDGRHCWCKECHHAYNRGRRTRRSKPVTCLKTLKNRHYESLIEQQGGACLICGGGNGTISLAVDHCHETGQLRGLLCNKCNAGLGYFNDNPLLLRAAALYLEAYQNKENQYELSVRGGESSGSV